MPPIGETLREARLRQKIDVAEVEQATKIRAKYLRALESEEFDRLPAPAYVRTFLRTYANFLGLDAHLLVEEYRVGHEPAPDDDVGGHLAPPPPPRRRRAEGGYRGGTGGGPGRGAMLVAGAVLGVVVLLLVIGLVTGGDDEGATGGPVATGEGGRGGKQQDESRGERSPAPQRDQVALRVTPVDATYVCVDDGDGKRVFEGLLDSPRTFRAETLRLNLGRTSAELEVNGDPVKLQETAEPVGFEFRPDGKREELALGERPCT